jgi:phage tail sheath protein FI
VAQAFALNDNIGGPWTVPAGASRGLISSRASEYDPSIDDRVLINVTNRNRINPIIRNANGPQLYGNRTLQRATSALENVHTQRMLIYVQELMAASVQYLVWEPNVEKTWRSFNALVQPILRTVQASDGIGKFEIVCDETTNPPALRQQKRMRALIRIEAVESAEVIEIESNLYPTGASFAAAA